MYQYLSQLNQSQLAQKVVVVRVDFNVPLKDSIIQDPARVLASKPTIQHILNHGGRVVLLAHLGRPKGFDSTLSFQSLVSEFSELLGVTVDFQPNQPLRLTKQAVLAMQAKVVLVDNIRFYQEEEANDLIFAKQLAALGDIFVLDALSVAHRAHASTEGIAHYLPAYVGLSLEHDIINLDKALKQSQPPVVAIIGGAKISTKLKVISHLLETADYVFIGGAMSHVFLSEKGINIGNSYKEGGQELIVKSILNSPFAHKLLLPLDGVGEMDGKKEVLIDFNLTNDSVKLLDIGPQTVSLLTNKLNSAKTIIWNGPLGLFEENPYHKGTIELAEVIIKLTQKKQIFSVAGGGDTLAALHQFNLQGLSYTSNSGGAFLEWLEGITLPALKTMQLSNS